MSIRDKIRGLKLNTKFTLLIIIAIVIPIAIFANILFLNMERNVIDTNIANMEYKKGQNTANIGNCIDSVNMATQFFLSDETMKNVLIQATMGKELSTEQLIEFKDGDITNLERLVSNNPLLYSVRIFASNDNVQEMMQILYKNRRMQNLSWLKDKKRDGWHFEYVDEAFSPLLINQSDKLVCLVSPVKDYKRGELGIVEASMKMSTMFPSLYENIEDEISCLVLEDGTIYGGDRLENESLELFKAAWERAKQQDSVCYVELNKKKIVIASLELKELGGSLVFLKDITQEIKHIDFIRNMFCIMMFILLSAFSFFINLIVNRMLAQFYNILKCIRKVQSGNLSVRIEHCGNDEMGELGNQLNKMLDRINSLMEQNIEREVMVKDSEIRALQNQINAHFIYNVLESIKMMAEIDEEYEISDSITSLGKLLRYSMRWVSGNVSVAQELDYIKNYMALINLRYDFVVNLSINIPENIMEQEIPKMSLQPIVENAILHGIEPMGEDSTIYIKGFSNGKDCIIDITDTGRGMSDEEKIDLEARIDGEKKEQKEKGNGIGLHNVQNRIKMSFGEGYGMTISAVKGCYTKVSICLPYKKREG